MFSLGIGIISMSLHSQAVVQSIEKDVSLQEVKAHLSFLTSDLLKGRATGSEGQQVAAEYISTHFLIHQVEPMDEVGGFFQKVPLRSTTPPNESSLSLAGVNYSFPKDFIILNGGQGNLQTETAFVGHASEDELRDVDLRLKLAVSWCGDGSSDDPNDWITHSQIKRELVKSKGAVGLVEIYRNAQMPWSMVSRIGRQEIVALSDPTNSDRPFPHLWLSPSTDKSVQDLKQHQAIKLDLDQVKSADITSSNVIGFVEGTDESLKNEYVVYTAHYDHVGIGRPDASGDNIYNGARDNAVGVVAVMMLAKHFAKYPPRRSSIFVLFTAEEKGLLGSKLFVNESPVPLSDIVYNFNIDNAGYNDTSLVSVIGLTRTSAMTDIEEACQVFGLTAIEDPAKEQGLFDRSDNVNFARKGIPAPTFSMGFTKFDRSIFEFYHQPSDEFESLNMNYVWKYIKSYVAAAQLIANRDERPFWTEGDKYYKAGVDLYQSMD